MIVKLEDVCESGSSNLRQSDVEGLTGEYPIYGAAGHIGNVGFYHQEKPYVAVVKDGAGIGRTVLLPPKSSVIGTMQYLLPKENVLPEYLYYVVRNMHLGKHYSGATIPHIYFRDYKSEEFNLVSLEKQREVVRLFKTVESIIDSRQKELQYLEDLVKARFVEMFGDLKTNPLQYEKKQLKETCTIITGNTPSRSVSNYYGEFVEWIKTDNIISERLYPTTAAEFLSEKGVEVGRTVDKDSILMACIAGSVASIGKVCITDRRVAFNQQINAIVPNEYDVRFLYVMLQLTKEYLVEGINMALKGILSKSKLEGKMFIVPPIAQQRQFSAFVARIDKSKFAVQQALNKAQLLFDSLMQKYFG